MSLVVTKPVDKPQNKLVVDLCNYLAAGFPMLWVDSPEPDRIIEEICQGLERANTAIPYILFDVFNALSWTPSMSCSQTLHNSKTKDKNVPGNITPRSSQFDTLIPLLENLPRIAEEMTHVVENIKRQSSGNIAPETGAPIPDTNRFVIILRNAHLKGLISENKLIQSLQCLIPIAKSRGFHFVFTGDSSKIPDELSRCIQVIRHDLPGAAELTAIGKSLLTAEAAAAHNWQEIGEAAKGLTRNQAEDAFALSLVKNSRICPREVWKLKAQAVRNSGLLEIYAGTESFDKLGGHEGFKYFAKTVLAVRRDNPKLRPKGLLLLGVPGSGKSHAVKCLAPATGRNVLTLDMGKIRTKYQGGSENNFANALRLADSMEPCILQIEEIEKALGGVGQSDADGGVSSRIFSTFLTWLNDHETDVLVVGTCNNIKSIPPEFTRAERFDGIFFFDVPRASERKAIWRMYLTEYGISYDDDDLRNYVEVSRNWTGSEIKSCCRLSQMLGETVRETMPIISVHAVKNREDVAELRDFATSIGCLSSATPKTKYDASSDRVDRPSTDDNNGRQNQRRQIAISLKSSKKKKR